MRSRVRRSEQAWSYVELSAPCFGTMVWADFLGARDCHVTPMPLALDSPRGRPSRCQPIRPAQFWFARQRGSWRPDGGYPPAPANAAPRGRTGVDGRSAASGIQRQGRVWLLATRPIV